MAVVIWQTDYIYEHAYCSYEYKSYIDEKVNDRLPCRAKYNARIYNVTRFRQKNTDMVPCK